MFYDDSKTSDMGLIKRCISDSAGYFIFLNYDDSAQGFLQKAQTMAIFRLMAMQLSSQTIFWSRILQLSLAKTLLQRL